MLESLRLGDYWNRETRKINNSERKTEEDRERRADRDTVKMQHPAGAAQV